MPPAWVDKSVAVAAALDVGGGGWGRGVSGVGVGDRQPRGNRQVPGGGANAGPPDPNLKPEGALERQTVATSGLRSFARY